MKSGRALSSTEVLRAVQAARSLFLSSGGAATRLRYYDWDGESAWAPAVRL